MDNFYPYIYRPNSPQILFLVFHSNGKLIFAFQFVPYICCIMLYCMLSTAYPQYMQTVLNEHVIFL